MSVLPSCPRCTGPLRAPGFWSSAWECERHGQVDPFHLAPTPTLAALEKLVSESDLPVWVPRPLPQGWTVAGVGRAGDERSGVRASVVALAGPAPRGGPCDIVLVAEQPGVGLGAHFAGIAGPDPGAPPASAAELKVECAGHPTALWRVSGADDRCALVGEAKGVWLWCVVWPGDVASVLDGFVLHDLHDGGHPELDLLFGAQSPRLLPPVDPPA
jgi:hypothetical protein